MESNASGLSFDDVASFIRSWARLPSTRRIAPETQFERDLGITGDDGSDLLEAVQKHFNVNLTPDETGYRKVFNLAPNEYLFNSEGFGIGAAVYSLFTTTSVRPFTVGELYKAIMRVQGDQRPDA